MPLIGRILGVWDQRPVGCLFLVPLWHPVLRPHFREIALTLLVGSYAIRHYLPESRRRSTTDVLARWRDYLPGNFVLPHPSWRTTAWERVNPWFAAEVLPSLRAAVAAALR